MKTPIVFMYSGQGSQYYQMGKQLFETNETFREHLLKTDAISQTILGHSILTELYHRDHAKSEPLKKTLFSHPAIFMFEYALTQVLLEKGIVPDYVLGSSMGEFAAATIAKHLSLEDALYMVIKQGEAFSSTPNGGMLAILENENYYTKESYLHEASELAAINFAKHIVVSGRDEALETISNELKKQDIISQLLPVSHAFHSHLIDPAKNIFIDAIKSVSIQSKARYPFITATTGNAISSLNLEHFWDIVRLPILFEKTIQSLENKSPMIYIDLGPSGTLANFVKYNLSQASQSKYIPLITPYSNENTSLEAGLKSLS